MKSNSKEVIKKIQEHILDYYDNNLEEFREQVECLYQPTNYHRIKYMAQGGCFIISSEEQRQFLNSLGINPNNKYYDDIEVFNLYCHLIARDGVKLLKGGSK